MKRALLESPMPVLDLRSRQRWSSRAPLQLVAVFSLLSLATACDSAEDPPPQLTVGGPNDTPTSGESSGSTSSNTGATTSATTNGDTSTDQTGNDSDDGDQCSRDDVFCAGECIDPETDKEHCGASNDCNGANHGEACRDDESCIDGRCTDEVDDCPGNGVRCDNDCIDPKTDRDFCGASGSCEGTKAGESCDRGEVCSDGRCDDDCPSGLLNCDDECIDPRTSHDFCGASGDDCDDEGDRCASDEVCVAGRCDDDCPRDMIACDETCIDPDVDPDYCGAEDDCEDRDAGEICDDSEVCVDGRCGDDCDDNDLVACERECINPESDTRFCGAEGNCEGSKAGESCRMDEQCISGRCEEAGGWVDHEKVSDGSEDAEEHAIARDDEDNVIVAYIEDGHVYANRSEKGDWDRAEKIDSDSSSDCQDLQLVMDSEGNAIAVWLQNDRLWRQRFDADDESWANSATQIPRANNTEPSDPSLAIERKDGRAALVWVNNSTSNSAQRGVGAVHFDGTRWGTTALSVTGVATQEIDDPHVSINGDGEALAVWTHDSSNSNQRIVAARYYEQNGTFAWRTPTAIDSSSADDQSDAQAYINEDGDSLALWVRDSSDAKPYFASMSTGTNSRWTAAKVIAGAEDTQSGDEGPRLVGTQSDTALAVWLDDDGSNTLLMASMWDGSQFEKADVIQIDEDSDADEFDVALSEEGFAMVLWTQTIDRDPQILSNWRDLDQSNGEWGDFAVPVNLGSDDVSMPIVCVDENGEASGAWLVDGSNSDVWSANFEPEDR